MRIVLTIFSNFASMKQWLQLKCFDKEQLLGIISAIRRAVNFCKGILATGLG